MGSLVHTKPRVLWISTKVCVSELWYCPFIVVIGTGQRIFLKKVLQQENSPKKCCEHVVQ